MVAITGVLTNTGLAGISKLSNGESTDYFKDLALGSSATAAAVTDTALGVEITTNGGARVLATLGTTTTTTTDDSATFTTTFTITGDLTVNEVGVFNTASVMLIRGVLPETKTLHSGDTYTLTAKWVMDQV